jgi:hypothetical protein
VASGVEDCPFWLARNAAESELDHALARNVDRFIRQRRTKPKKEETSERLSNLHPIGLPTRKPESVLCFGMGRRDR